MAEPFVPLVPSAKPRQTRPAPTLLKIIHPAETKPAIPGALAGATAKPAPAPGAEPKITLQKEGETITGIQVQCSCGQVIELACSY